MHQCLKVQEVVSRICDQLNKPSALALALTRKRFFEPAMDRCWRDLTSFAPLVSCLPEDLLEEEPADDYNDRPSRMMQLRRMVTASDLQRYIDVYSKRIVSFQPTPEGGPQAWLSVDALRAIQLVTDGKRGVLSPFLKRFHMPTPGTYQWFFSSDVANQLAPCMALFVGPQVTTLGFPSLGNCYLYCNTINSLTGTISRLKKLTLTTYADDLSKSDIFVHDYLTVFSWDHLQELNLQLPEMRATDALIQRLSSLPELAKLSLSIDLSELEEGRTSTPDCNSPSPGPNFDDGDVPPLPGSWPYPFLSLTSLTLHVLSPPDILSFLGYLPRRIKFKSLVCDSTNATSDEDIQTILNMVHERCDHDTLTSFTLKVNENGTEQEEMIDMDEGGGLDIEPLLRFQSLSSLKIVINGRYRLTPNVVAQISSSWPDMRTMIFHSTFQTTQIPQIDHMDLLALVQSLPLLEVLEVRFDSTKILGHELAMGAPLPLEVLDVGDSPISSPSRVASFLKANFSLQEPPAVHQSSAWEVPMYKTRWEVVQNSGSPWTS